MSNIVPFQFDANELRAISKDGEPWFVLNDVCRVLEISNARDAATRLDDDEKAGVVIPDAIGRAQNTTIISESGLYALILTSRKPEAKRFRKWVTAEVLPELRKTGSYSVRETPPKQIDAIQAMLDVIRNTEERVTRVEGAIENFGAHEDYRSIKAHAAIIGVKIKTKQSGDLGKAATALSKRLGHVIGKQPDDSFGTVNTYHRDVLEEIFSGTKKEQA